MTETGTPSDIPAENLEALRRSGLLDSAREARFDRVTRMVGDVLEVPVCLISLIDEDRQFFKAATGLPGAWDERREAPRRHSFCRHVVLGGGPLRVTDARADPRVRENAAVRELGIVSYLGVPIRFGGVAIGALCVMDRRLRDWTEHEVERLTDFAAIIDSEIELLRLAAERDEARKEAEVVAREHAHRVKNSLSVAASLVTLSAAEAATVGEAARTARARIMALAAAQNLIWSREGAGELRSLLDTILGPYRLDGDSLIRIEGQPVRLPDDKVTPLSLIFHELATNASKHGALSGAGGSVDLDWRAAGDRLAIRWSERPAPPRALAEAPAQFEAHAEKLEQGEGEGFGTQLVGLCVRQLSARLDVGKRADGGREVELSLPWPGGAAMA